MRDITKRKITKKGGGGGGGVFGVSWLSLAFVLLVLQLGMWYYVVRFRMQPAGADDDAAAASAAATTAKLKTHGVFCMFFAQSPADVPYIDVMEQHVVPHCDGWTVFTSDAKTHTALRARYDARSGGGGGAPSSAFAYDVHLLPATGQELWQRRRKDAFAALMWAYDNAHDQFDYFIKVARPDVLLHVDNLRALLEGRQYAPRTGRVYLGHVLTEDDLATDVYVSGLGTYVMSSGFVKAIGDSVDAQSCIAHMGEETHHGAEFSLSCLAKAGATIGDSRDDVGREYFQPFQALDHYERMQWQPSDWFWRGKSPRNVKENCCATWPVSFQNYRSAASLAKLYACVYKRASPSGLTTLKDIAACQKTAYDDDAV